VLLLQMDPVPQHHSPVEGETRFGAVPVDELGYGMVIGTLTAFRREAVQDGGFGLFEIGKGQDSFGRTLLLAPF